MINLVTRLLAILMAIVFLTISFTLLCTKKVMYKGIILQHTIGTTREGYVTYHTIGKFEDGSIREVDGLNTYVKPIGSIIYYETRTIK
jgi:hypothetical protein